MVCLVGMVWSSRARQFSVIISVSIMSWSLWSVWSVWSGLAELGHSVLSRVLVSLAGICGLFGQCGLVEHCQAIQCYLDFQYEELLSVVCLVNAVWSERARPLDVIMSVSI